MGTELPNRRRYRSDVGIVVAVVAVLYAIGLAVNQLVSSFEVGGAIAWAVVAGIIASWAIAWLRGSASAWLTGAFLALALAGVAVTACIWLVDRSTQYGVDAWLFMVAFVGLALVPVLTIWAWVDLVRPVRPKRWRATRYFGSVGPDVDAALR